MILPKTNTYVMQKCCTETFLRVLDSSSLNLNPNSVFVGEGKYSFALPQEVVTSGRQCPPLSTSRCQETFELDTCVRYKMDPKLVIEDSTIKWFDENVKLLSG